MHLTSQEEAILEGEQGWIRSQALRLLVKLGQSLDAARLIPISWAHLSGISYWNIGDAGWEFLQDWLGSGIKFQAYTTLNPAGMDLELWPQLGISSEFAANQLKIIQLFKDAGADPILSCIPHQYRALFPGQILSWAESSAACYANFLGARTNRESGLSALAAALIGKTPEYGYHLDENRAPQISIQLDFQPKTQPEFGLIGYLAGQLCRDSVPSFELDPSPDQALSLAAGLASSSQLGIFHLRTRPGLERIQLEQAQIRELLDSSPSQGFFLGCPHLNLEQLIQLDSKLKTKLRYPVWICCPRFLGEGARQLIANLRAKGAQVIHDTCLVVSPIPTGYECLSTDSAKAWHYLSRMHKLQVKLAPLENCLSWLIS